MTQTQAGPATEAGRALLLDQEDGGLRRLYDDDQRAFADAILAIEQQAAALERRKMVERVEAVALLIRPARREEYGEPGNRQWRDVDDAWTQLRAILDTLASESEPQ